MTVSCTIASSCWTLLYLYHTPDFDDMYNLQLAGERCGKSFPEAQGNEEKELKLMLDWAFEGFLPTGPDGFIPVGMSVYF